MATYSAAAQPVSRVQPLGHLLVFLAVAQVTAGALSSTLGDSELMKPDRPGQPAITPSGYAFAIWGVIELFSVALAVWFVWFQRSADDGDRAAITAITRPLLIVFAGFTLWLVAAELEPVWATLVVFAVMGIGLFLAIRAALAHSDRTSRWPALGRFLLWAAVGSYAGWSTVALWINLTTALTFSGAPVTGTAGLVGQLAILAGITATAVFVLRWTRGSIAYAAAVAWALVAAILGALHLDQPVLAGATVAGLVVTVVTLAVFRLRPPTRRSAS